MPWLLAVVGLLLYEMYSLYTGRPTLTAMMRRADAVSPIFRLLVGLVCGLLLGHFFWCP
jgi:hypothetical protein